MGIPTSFSTRSTSTSRLPNLVLEGVILVPLSLDHHHESGSEYSSKTYLGVSIPGLTAGLESITTVSTQLEMSPVSSEKRFGRNRPNQNTQHQLESNIKSYKCLWISLAP